MLHVSLFVLHNRRYWLVYDIVCKGYLFFITFNVPLSAFIIVAVSFDRYFCICHPFLHVVSVRRAKICVACLTLIACGFGVTTALGHGVYYKKSLSNSSHIMFDLNSSSTEPHLTSANSKQSYQRSNLEQILALYNIEVCSNGSLSNQSCTIRNSQMVTLTHPHSATNNSLTISRVTYYGMCISNNLIFNERVFGIYQKVYAATYLLCFLTVVPLYALIYRTILLRRAWRAKSKLLTSYAYTVNKLETCVTDTFIATVVNGNTLSLTEVDSTAKSPPLTSSTTPFTTRDRMLYANIRTAAMLFVVTLVFLVSFLPSWLIGLKVLPMNYLLFYLFFLNNVANPFIYSFMNKTFRDDLKQLLRRIKNSFIQ